MAQKRPQLIKQNTVKIFIHALDKKVVKMEQLAVLLQTMNLQKLQVEKVDVLVVVDPQPPQLQLQFQWLMNLKNQKLKFE